MSQAFPDIPEHLSRYIVEQDYSRYTPIDQAVWRFIMKQLRSFLSTHAHPCYLEGLKRTGIETDRIPEISRVSQLIEKFGWRAVPVSGFIPPAAFMELQALSYLPIASDMRSLEHLSYTPAPDIVHEAAGHAPILVEAEFAHYLKAYAQVARKAIVSDEDISIYEAIRALSDIKEDPSSTPELIKTCEEKLNALSKSTSHVSEATRLSRMNWWTAEYGLIGDIKNPKIFGAGLLSSIGEARACLSDKVRKIPLTLECIEFTYDITEPQPQLFVTPNFDHLIEVLDQLAKTMAFRTGGVEALDKLIRSKSINTVQLSSGVQIGGRLEKYRSNAGEITYLQFKGPSQLAENDIELEGHDSKYHQHGFGTPVGTVVGFGKCLSQAGDEELKKLGLKKSEAVHLKFTSGVEIHGKFKSSLKGSKDQTLVLSFYDCTVKHGSDILFDPAWGVFDMAVGQCVQSAWGGPPDRGAFGEVSDFARKIIPRKQVDQKTQSRHRVYDEIQFVRRTPKAARQSQVLEAVYKDIKQQTPGEWLPHLDLLEIAESTPNATSLAKTLRADLQTLSKSNEVETQVREGLKVLEQLP